MIRILIAEHGTDWMAALRRLSLAQVPFTTLVQGRDDSGFLRERPWGPTAPADVILLCGGALSAAKIEARLALLRHVSESAPQPTVWILADREEDALATESFVETLQSQVAPSLRVQFARIEDVRRVA